MSVIATGQISIVDLSDGKSLSCYITSNLPKTQVYDPNYTSVVPDWTGDSNLVLTPVVFVNQTSMALDAAGLSVTWKRREGANAETDITAGESVLNGILTVNANQLTAITSGLLSYLAYVTYTDPENGLVSHVTADITFSQIKTAVNAKLVSISGEQVFKYDVNDSVSPAQITLTANLANVTVDRWQYKNESDVWTDYPSTADNTNITSDTLNVKPSHGVFNGDAAVLRILTSEAGVTDTVSIYKVRDGQTGSAGSNASTVFLTNENITFVGNASGEVAVVARVCNVVGYTGASKVTPAVGAITGAPTGMTVEVGTAVSNEIPITITIAEGATLGGSAQQQGVLSVPITSPVNTTLQIQWSKVNTGVAGADGQNAIVFSLYAPNGSVFQNQSGTLLIQTSAYDGTTEISAGATFVWKKYTAGSWNTIAGQTGGSLTVNGEDVNGVQAYQCIMTYDGKTYTDTITITDKSDNYQANIESTGGDVFRNTVGESCLICRLYQNASEVDALKATVFSVNAPAEPVAGDFYYKITKSTPQVALMRYSGSAWVDVTDDATYKHEKTYTWYRRDKDGNALDSGSAFAIGKVIFIDGDDVDVKTTFTCEVS